MTDKGWGKGREGREREGYKAKFIKLPYQISGA